MATDIEKIVKKWWMGLHGARGMTVAVLPANKVCDINDVERLIDVLRGNSE